MKKEEYKKRKAGDKIGGRGKNWRKRRKNNLPSLPWEDFLKLIQSSLRISPKY